MLLSHSRDQGLYPHQIHRSRHAAGKKTHPQLRCGFLLCLAQQIVCASVPLHRSIRMLRKAHSLLSLFFVVLYLQHDPLFRHMSRIQRMTARADSGSRRELLYRLCHNPEHPYRHTVCFRTISWLFVYNGLRVLLPARRKWPA